MFLFKSYSEKSIHNSTELIDKSSLVFTFVRIKKAANS